MIYNTEIFGLDEAAFLIALGFPLQTVSKIETVDLNSQSSASLPDRLSWHFGDVSTQGLHIGAVQQSFKLPHPKARATSLGQRARLAACNFQALKSALISGAPLFQKRGNGWTLLRNGDGEPIPRLNETPAPGWCRTSAALAIACAFGSTLDGVAQHGGVFYGVPHPAAPGEMTPAKIEAFLLSPAPADPTDYSDLAVMAAMFVMRSELLKIVNESRRVALTFGRKRAVLSAGASGVAKDKAFNFLTNGR